MKIVFATNNLNKLSEIRALVPKSIEILSLKDINCNDELPETRDTLEGNAAQKAEYIVEKYGIACFSDDTGLMVDALNGAPGVYSARFAGPKCDSNDNMDLLLEKLTGESNRNASFKTVICLKLNNETHLFDGIAEGEIGHEKVGLDGFGYDPIFFPEGLNTTFAEMSKSEKGKISHRGRAVAKLVTYLNTIKA